jgi:hypothetical protein
MGCVEGIEGHGYEENVEEASKIVGGGTPEDLGWTSKVEKERGSFLGPGGFHED